MSKSKQTPLEVVERYHQIYLEYEGAFNNDPFNRKSQEDQIKELAESGVQLDSDDFFDKMVEIILDKNKKIADVNNAAFKFVLFTDFYLLTQDTELPEKILKDYDQIPIKDSIKPYFSINNGEFVRNEETDLDDNTKKYFQDVVKSVRESLANG